MISDRGENVNCLATSSPRRIAGPRQSEFTVPAGRIIGVEEELREEVIPGCPDLLARIDLLVEDSDELVVADLKTARGRWSQGAGRRFGRTTPSVWRLGRAAVSRQASEAAVPGHHEDQAAGDHCSHGRI